MEINQQIKNTITQHFFQINLCLQDWNLNLIRRVRQLTDHKLQNCAKLELLFEKRRL